MPVLEAVVHVEETRGCAGGTGRSAGGQTNVIIMIKMVMMMSVIIINRDKHKVACVKKIRSF